MATIPDSGSVTVAFGTAAQTFRGDAPVWIGRDPDCDICIDHYLVSRKHLSIRHDPTGWIVRDNSSTNGTLMGGSRISEVSLTAPVELLLGGTEGAPSIVVSPDSAPANQPPAAMSPLSAPSGMGAVLTQGMGLPTGFIDIATAASSRIRIGRAPDNDVVLDDLGVSRHHADLVRGASGVLEIVDLGSSNGTFVNGQRITKSRVVDDDLVSVYNRVFRVVGGRLEEYVDSGNVTFAVENLLVEMGGTPLVDGVSFSLEKQSFLAVLGTTGAGKSTLMKAISGVRSAESGRVLYAGRDLYESYDELRYRIGIVPQDDILHAELPLRRALAYAAELRFPRDTSAVERQNRIEEVLAELGLTERADLTISKLSGGQRKRTSIALELLTKPSLLFLDEPTSGLDPGYEKTVMSLMRGLADGGRTVVVVTHSVQSLSMCDRVLFLAPGGKTAFFGPPDDVLSYFGVDDFADVFTSLETNRTFDWAGRFIQSPGYERFVRGPLQVAPVEAAPVGDVVVRVRASRPKGRLRQVVTLSRRYLASIVADKRNLAMLLLQAPILAALIMTSLVPGSFNPAEVAANPNADPTGAIVFVIITAIWLGASNAIREIVKERPIYQRESMVGLSPAAYVTSKFLVLAGFTALQATMLVLIATAREHGPPSASAIGMPKVELIIAASLAGISSMALGLLVSAFVKSADKALTLLPLLVVPQLVMTGALQPLEDKPGMAQLSKASSAYWGVSAAASTVDMNHLNNIQFDTDLPEGAPSRRPKVKLDHSDWQHTPRAFWTNIGMMVMLTFVFMIGAWIAVRRQ